MKDSHQQMSAALELNKRALAARYSVGVRTVENWQAMRLIPARWVQGEWIFDADECDRRLLAHTSETRKEVK